MQIERREVPAVDQDRTGVRPAQPQEQRGGRALAGPAGSGEHDHLPAPKLEVDLVQHGPAAIRLLHGDGGERQPLPGAGSSVARRGRRLGAQDVEDASGRGQAVGAGMEEAPQRA
jgi:hypothetical protein